MVSAVTVQLAQEKALSLNDPISKYIPGVPNGDKITLELLMKNRSGLYNYVGSPKLAEAFDKDPLKIWTPQELLSISFENPIQFRPNERFDYSNTNFILLGLVAEQIDKKPLAQIFKDRLFDPLKMNNTYLPQASETTIKKPYSHGYAYGKSAHAFSHQPFPREMQEAVEAGTLEPKDYTIQSPSWAWAAGGVISNAEDLAIWIESLAQGKLFTPEYYEKWLASPELSDPNSPNVKYGYGFLTISNGSDLFYFHNGELPGFSSYMIYNLANKEVIIIWSNLTDSILTVPTADKIMKAVYDVLYKPEAIKS
jgi:D-alanyl-D-alanine carboxypeptidase